jgi:hypothetical protein
MKPLQKSRINMKIASFLIFFFTGSLIAQGLQQEEFDKIDRDVKETLLSINDSDDFLKLIEKFNLSGTDSTQIQNFTHHNKIEFWKNMHAKSHILPFYFLTENLDELELTIFSVTIEPQRKGEEFHRGKYHFVLTSMIKIENDNVIYRNSEMMIKQNSINSWFLKGYQSYLDKTKLVFDEFGFTPPPPPLPPSTLK